MFRNSLFLFGEYLVNQGALTSDQLAQALTEQIHGNFSNNRINVNPSTRLRIGEVVVHLGFITSEQLEYHLAQYETVNLEKKSGDESLNVGESRGKFFA